MHRRLLGGAAAAVFALTTMAATPVPEQGWDPVLPLAGTWLATASIGDADTAWVGADNINEIGAHRTVVFRTDDRGRTWLPVAPPTTGASELTARDATTIAARGTAGTVMVSTDGGIVWERPDLERSSAVAFDPDDGSLWSTSGLGTPCEQGAGAQVLGPELAAVQREVRVPTGWYAYRDIVPGPGSAVIASLARCDFTGPKAIFTSSDDGVTWQHLTDVAGNGFLPEAVWTDDGRAVVPVADDRLLVVDGIADGRLRTATHAVLTGSTPLPLLDSTQLADLDLTGATVVTTTRSGVVMRARLDGVALRDREVLRDGEPTALGAFAQVFADGTIIARVDQLALERRDGELDR